MQELLLKVKTHNNVKLSDDELVQEWMNMLLAKYPQISSYQFWRQEDYILLLLWGEFEVVE